MCLVYVTLGLCKTNKEMPLCPPFLLAHMFVGLEPSTCTLLSHSWKLEGAPRVDYGCPGLTHQALGHQRSHLISLITHRARVDSGVWSLPPSNLHHGDQQCPSCLGKGCLHWLLGPECKPWAQTSGSPLRSDQRVSDGVGV